MQPIRKCLIIGVLLSIFMAACGSATTSVRKPTAGVLTPTATSGVLSTATTPTAEPQATSTTASANPASCSVFPADNIWNRDIASLPLDPNSAQYINSIGANGNLHPDVGTDPTYGIPYNVVTDSQAAINVNFDYADESDAGPYPIPSQPLIEGGTQSTGDRHILMLNTQSCMLYELYDAQLDQGHWRAGSGAIWNLRSNALRPAGWTSADAAGLPIFPGLVRYDEVAAGAINHALRFTVQHTRNTYLWPARHQASNLTASNLPPMGLRLRLKANFAISGFPQQDQVILRALQHYGMIVADNGSNWYLTGAPDPRWNDDTLNALKQISGSDFEVVNTSSLLITPDSGQSK